MSDTVQVNSSEDTRRLVAAYLNGTGINYIDC